MLLLQAPEPAQNWYVVEPVRSLRWSAIVEFGCIVLIIVGCLRKCLSLFEMVVFQEADCDKSVPMPVPVAVSRGRKLELEASEFGIHEF